jgi:hypothetical protein
MVVLVQCDKEWISNITSARNPIILRIFSHMERDRDTTLKLTKSYVVQSARAGKGSGIGCPIFASFNYLLRSE